MEVPEIPEATNSAQLSKTDDEPASELQTRQSRCCRCQWALFQGCVTAQAYSVHGIGRGPIYMATIFLSTAFIHLASEQVGCLEVDPETGEDVIVDDCDARVYGTFSPAALVTNIAIISGVLIALFMPMIGAIIDFTPHRWTVGAVSAFLLILTEIAQIFTTSETWFAMAIVEAISGFLFQVQILASLAYLPDIAREAGQKSMNSNSAYFQMVEMGTQVSFVFLTVAISMVLGLGDVQTAQAGQMLAAVVSGVGFYLAWKRFPKVPAKHAIRETSDSEAKKPNLMVAGFVQNWNTLQRINRDYKNSIRWFLLAVVFAEAAANAYLTVAVIMLTEHLGMDVTEVGIFFLISLVAMFFACRIGEIMANLTNPNTSWRLSMLYTFTLTLTGALTLNRDNANPFSYVWGFVNALGLGWYYQAIYLYMSMVTPKNQEAELAGFFNYCRFILVWLPPLLFSLLVEADISQSIGVVVTITFFLVAIGFLSLSPPWDDVLEEVHKTSPLNPKEPNDAVALEEEPSEVPVPVERVGADRSSVQRTESSTGN